MVPPEGTQALVKKETHYQNGLNHLLPTSLTFSLFNSPDVKEEIKKAAWSEAPRFVKPISAKPEQREREREREREKEREDFYALMASGAGPRGVRTQKLRTREEGDGYKCCRALR